jgi:ketosteroid isomerase-like protein
MKTLTRRQVVASALGASAALTVPSLARAGVSHGSEQIGEIYQLQAAFHSAKSHQDIDLMVSLWTEDSSFTFNGATFTGKQGVHDFFLGSGSWKHRRMSLVPSFKDQIEVHGNTAWLYFECHDVVLETGDVAPVGSVVTHLVNAGQIRRDAGTWRYWRMTFGSIQAPGFDVDRIFLA